jgi:hypothetical protein
MKRFLLFLLLAVGSQPGRAEVVRFDIEELRPGGYLRKDRGQGLSGNRSRARAEFDYHRYFESPDQ